MNFIILIVGACVCARKARLTKVHRNSKFVSSARDEFLVEKVTPCKGGFDMNLISVMFVEGKRGKNTYGVCSL